MDKIKSLFKKLKRRIVSFIAYFKTFDPAKKAITIIISLLCICILFLLFFLFRSVVGKLLIGIGFILFIAGIVIGIKEKSALLAVIIILISMIPVGLGNVISPKEAEAPETTTEEFVRVIADATDLETTTEAPTTTEPETTEDPIEPETEPQAEEEHDYVINTNTGVFHRPGCASVSKMKSKNRADWHCTRDEVIAAGYSPCNNCHP